MDILQLTQSAYESRDYSRLSDCRLRRPLKEFIQCVRNKTEQF